MMKMIDHVCAATVEYIDRIEAMGKELIRVRDMSEATCDNILRSYL